MTDRDPRDHEARYNLGIAYKEMGLVDQAIAEFQFAAKSEALALESASMLGICFMEKGIPNLAVKWFKKGLKAQGSQDQYLGLSYDLASALEASGDADSQERARDFDDADLDISGTDSFLAALEAEPLTHANNIRTPRESQMPCQTDRH